MVKLNPKKLGKAIAAYIMITVDYTALKQAKTSQYDLSVKLKCQNFPSIYNRWLKASVTESGKF